MDEQEIEVLYDTTGPVVAFYYEDDAIKTATKFGLTRRTVKLHKDWQPYEIDFRKEVAKKRALTKLNNEDKGALGLQ